MIARRNAQRPPGDKLGILRVDIAPLKLTSTGIWDRFRGWLRDTMRFVLPRDRTAQDEARQFAAGILDAGKAKLQGISAETARIEASVAEGLMRARSLQVEGSRSEQLLPDDQELRRAEAEKLREEAATLRTKRHLEALEGLRKHGYSAVPIITNGELTGLFFSGSQETQSRDADREPHPMLIKKS
jgi:hypothetical protein